MSRTAASPGRPRVPDGREPRTTTSPGRPRVPDDHDVRSAASPEGRESGGPRVRTTHPSRRPRTQPRVFWAAGPPKTPTARSGGSRLGDISPDLSLAGEPRRRNTRSGGLRDWTSPAGRGGLRASAAVVCRVPPGQRAAPGLREDAPAARAAPGRGRCPRRAGCPRPAKMPPAGEDAPVVPQIPPACGGCSRPRGASRRPLRPVRTRRSARTAARRRSPAVPDRPAPGGAGSTASATAAMPGAGRHAAHGTCRARSSSPCAARP